MTLPALMVGVLIGGAGALALINDEIKRRDDELRALREQARPMRISCPDFTVKVATQDQGGNWNVRCVGRGKVRAM